MQNETLKNEIAPSRTRGRWYCFTGCTRAVTSGSSTTYSWVFVNDKYVHIENGVTTSPDNIINAGSDSIFGNSTSSMITVSATSTTGFTLRNNSEKHIIIHDIKREILAITTGGSITGSSSAVTFGVLPSGKVLTFNTGITSNSSSATPSPSASSTYIKFWLFMEFSE